MLLEPNFLLRCQDVQNAFAQSSTAVVYTDPKTGITFDTWPVPDSSSGSGTIGGMTFGMALPSDALTTNANEFIGYLVSDNIYATVMTCANASSNARQTARR